jgi:hypothetical protein
MILISPDHFVSKLTGFKSNKAKELWKPFLRTIVAKYRVSSVIEYPSVRIFESNKTSRFNVC